MYTYVNGCSYSPIGVTSMVHKTYHHGNLENELVEAGLYLIHEEGIGNFSLRKLAKKIGVSPTACYNHFSTADDLLNKMKSYVTKKFCNILIAEVNTENLENIMINMGKAYVQFFVDNPQYFSFIYERNTQNIFLTEDDFTGDFEPFCIFREYAIKCMEYNHIDKTKYHDNLIVMWATVHGLVSMANMKGLHYEGDWEELTHRILLTKVNLQ